MNIVETLDEHENIGSLSCRLCDMHSLICMDCINCWEMPKMQDRHQKVSDLYNDDFDNEHCQAVARHANKGGGRHMPTR